MAEQLQVVKCIKLAKQSIYVIGSENTKPPNPHDK